MKPQPYSRQVREDNKQITKIKSKENGAGFVPN